MFVMEKAVVILSEYLSNHQCLLCSIINEITFIFHKILIICFRVYEWNGDM